MKRYLVGGAVRDELLGLPVKDRDWVVVGETQATMEAAGFRAVGRDFPVFLDPDTNDEVALARTERKTGPGYRGFVVDSAPSVTLEEDLQRRDLTINAMARDPATGDLVDPWGGATDLEGRRLRHVSPAFVEDPVRILRVARFAARFAPLGFEVAPETTALMREMVAAGEVDALVPERVWQELERALGEQQPSAFLRVLRESNALGRILPEVDPLYGVQVGADTGGDHLERVLEACAAIAPSDTIVAFAGLMHDLGRGAASGPPEEAGVRLVEALCERLRVPRAHARVAVRACRLHRRVRDADRASSADTLALIEAADGLRQPEAFEAVLKVCEAIMETRRSEAIDTATAFLRRARDAAAAVDTKTIAAQGITGPAFGEALAKARVHAIEALRSD
ncbi:MAG: multifunctional CCA addition/repair protein [Pseudomonadota bacterium]